MRNLTFRALVFGVLAALPLIGGCSNDGAEANASAPASAATASSTPPVSAGLARADFNVAGMDCGGCVIGTRAALRKLEGVESADASYDDATGKGSAWALYDPAKVSPERLMAAIRELGYTPTPIQAQS